ncbi:S8 family serine peptidase [Glacieibacterium frigidum]|uniref:S8 family serine peptidase n=1 Tax=Glacieibacterium frigidum TaxID=2593303 RepID=A0A552UF33_9SPHN|nr:S8 family serine peptidase [Glacieibacterium frigidum]TRW16832.1 S8 family serine peptidase [Glacieibacterium frigidum]
MSDQPGLLIKLRRADAAGFAANNRLGVSPAGLEPILAVPAPAAEARGFSDHPNDAVWYRAPAAGSAWDAAHDAMRQGFAAGNGIMAAEPDFAQSFAGDDGSSPADCTARPQSPEGNRAVGAGDDWHLGDAYSGLARAAASVSPDAQARILIAHLDTGYDIDHPAMPAGLQAALERDFTRRGDTGAADRTPDGGIPGTRNRGHGTGTLSILAGRGFGGAPHARVMAVRIADSVVRFTTSTMVQGIDHARSSGAHVLSMSMGGLASAALADAVNAAYEAGLTLVTAAGNNFAPGLPIRSVVYPARMRRVIAATGVMADGRPYFSLDTGTMQGCWGPPAKMATAIAGYSPNIPWAMLGCGTVRRDGEGTSAATPQVAAAAALWLAAHLDDPKVAKPSWQRVEAVRHALFSAARKTTAGLDAAGVERYLGTGALDAFAALGIGVPAKLVPSPAASAAWDWVKLLSGQGVGFALAAEPRAKALGLELMQLAGADREIEATLLKADPDDGVSARDRKRFFHAVLDSGRASQRLTAALVKELGLHSAPPAPPPPPDAPPPAPPPVAMAPRKPRQDPVPSRRRLRVFALDPSLGASLGTHDIKEATVSVAYEADGQGLSKLRPGPVGEYVEVVDIDPASDRVHAPVDLDHPHLLITDGLAPSEGNPRFHQQMVYAIAMKTIGNFEDALGRKLLWAPRRHRVDGRTVFEYVPRLRIYPHALRDRNAYYSPSKVALLFGYFPAQSADDAVTVRGSMVFACLSADIIAHEMTHAILDGVHRHYQEQTNPDVAAFHEGFADIVALFQHFTYDELVRHEVARARGKLGATTLLAGLARQFGLGSGEKAALRDYLDPDTGALDLAKTTESHQRGSILVFAIYEAFLAIVERRTGDLIRLATGGTGELPPGDLHPGLVDRLTKETCKAASQLLRICIRAMDYCPPNDIGFGEYLRALMTADVDSVPDDKLGYRTALLEAFRKHGLLPPRLRTVSVESLIWLRPQEPRPAWLGKSVKRFAIDWANNGDRWTSFVKVQERSTDLHLDLAEAFADPVGGPDLCAALGLQHGLPRYNDDFSERDGHDGKTTFSVHSLRRVRRAQPNGELSYQIVAVIAQRRAEWRDPDDESQGKFWFRGGATLIIDPAASTGSDPVPEIRYVIVKHMLSADRLRRQRAYAAGAFTGGMRAQYFDTRAMAAAEPFAMLHRGDPA